MPGTDTLAAGQVLPGTGSPLAHQGPHPPCGHLLPPRGRRVCRAPTRWRPARYSRELARRWRIRALIRAASTFSRRAGEGYAGEPTRQLPARRSGRMARRFARPPILVSPLMRGEARNAGPGASESAEWGPWRNAGCALQKRMTCFGAGEALWRSRMTCFGAGKALWRSRMVRFGAGEALWTSRIMCFGAGEALWKSRMMRFGAGEALWRSRMTCFGTGDAPEKAGDVLSSG